MLIGNKPSGEEALRVERILATVLNELQHVSTITDLNPSGQLSRLDNFSGS